MKRTLNGTTHGVLRIALGWAIGYLLYNAICESSLVAGVFVIFGTIALTLDFIYA